MNSESDVILGIDTATKILRLALRYGPDRMVKSEEPAEHSHGQILMRKIDSLLESCGIARKEIGAVVVNRGPGSFTGLRIGIATARGISVSLGLPAVGVNMFEIVATRFREHSGRVFALSPLKRDACVASTIIDGNWVSDSMRVVGLKTESEEISARVEKLVAIGFDKENLPVVFESHPRIQIIEYDAGDLITVGQMKLTHSAVDSGDLANELEPVYAQPSLAEMRLANREK